MINLLVIGFLTIYGMINVYWFCEWLNRDLRQPRFTAAAMPMTWRTWMHVGLVIASVSWLIMPFYAKAMGWL